MFKKPYIIAEFHGIIDGIPCNSSLVGDTLSKISRLGIGISKTFTDPLVNIPVIYG